ncbi:C3HC4 type (RING finger) zinc finger protein (macronuclear) [Tetrahymena thermophila SB210]|uniref:C3HC4 type (RING finger) zinc finger protein n=1 Tax=Tetrahymena thermophila (strain SB210) TaxID=312017 RepID=I7LVP7_TETTS|nr:C3HC4 type (RING finger) zinc finger protein [Tetrahymena thermophila SB210]EAR99478.2 C3HC4 type (RING finger) zinc finger protein [Tetrahymena thermophila SB210]|eukprot:XP_001019723.2 C3HC4 type (RING finger) zinc finger protein [Tetrahymena thermophila SB210]
MQLIEVENQINMQYLTQLLQNEEFDIKKYKYRNNLWNADHLNSQELLSLYRQFQFYDSAKRQAALSKINPEHQGINQVQQNLYAQADQPCHQNRRQKNKSSIQGSFENQFSQNQYENQRGEDFVEINVDSEVRSMRRNNSENNLYEQRDAQENQGRPLEEIQPLSIARRSHEDPYTVKIIISDMDEINFPATMQKYPFRHNVYDLTNFSDVVTKGILRRLIFLSISGYIGFDNSERAELVRGAFLLEFDAFFEYLMKPSICQILKFDQQDDVLEVISFMWEINIRKSMKYYDFIVKLATLNPEFYKKDGNISSKMLDIDVCVMEAQLLPLIQRIFQSDASISSSKQQTIMKQIIEYYEIHNGKHIIYPFIQQKSEKDVADQIEEKFQNLLKEFDCPICFLPFENCYTSKCGHSFCQSCIQSSVQKFGNCPVCQQNISQEDLFRNFHMNEIKSIAYKEKEETKNYEINRLKHMNSFKEKFQQIMQTNIINSVQAQLEKKQLGNNSSNNNECVQSFESIQKLKKQIQYLVNITFDQLMDSFNIES